MHGNSKEQEVLYLHSEQCFDNSNRCSDLYPSYLMTNYDGEAYHAPLKDYFSKGKINWNVYPISESEHPL